MSNEMYIRTATIMLFLCVAAMSLNSGCSQATESGGESADASARPDASAPDGATPDAVSGEPDARPPDAGGPDALVLSDARVGADAAPLADAAPAEGVSIVLGASVTTTIAGHIYTGSENAVDECPDGYALTGVRGRLRVAYNGPIQGVCRALGLTQGPLTVTTGTLAEMPTHGDVFPDDIPWSRDCPDGQMIAGVEGRAGAIIDRLVFRCVPLAVTPDAPYVVTTGAVTLLDAVGGFGGAAFTPASCASGQIARGLSTYFNGDPGFGLGSIYLDGVGLRCSTPSVQ